MAETGIQLWLETSIVYWIGIFILYFLDPYPWHLIIPTKKHSRSPLVSLCNQLFVNGALAIQLNDCKLYFHDNFWSDIPKLPLYYMIASGLFYYIHRLFHHVPILQRFHRHHHHWTIVKPVDTFDCHPIEQLCINIFPIMFPAWCLHISFYSFRFILHFSIISSLLAHFNWKDTLITNQFHKMHHLKPSVNFGQGTTLFDKLHGTYFKQPIT